MNLQENIRRILKEEDRYDDKVGKTFWFEYHCYESPESCDAEIWYRSHQKVKVIGVSEWSYDDKEWRQEDGNPRVYLVEWSDGYQYDVFEDELMESPDEFYRPSPPKRKIQESIRRILREELSPRVKRRIDSDEMEKEFLESFDSAYRLTKDRKVLRAHFLDELIYTTITMMMDGYHWRFVSTLPEDEFWYDDIHTGLQNHYKDRIIQMYNERQGINESILREEKETEFSTPFKRRLGRFTSFVWDNNVINYPCDFENFDSFIHGIHAEVMDMVSDGSDTDGPLSDWLTYIDAIRYIQRYMSDDLKEYYNRECVNKALKEATESDDKKDSKAPIVDVILMGGLDYRKGDLNIGEQINLLKSNSSKKNVIGYRYNQFTEIKNSITQNPNATVVLFSAGCSYASNVASLIKDKNKLFIVEPYAVSKNTSSSVKTAVGKGVPSSHVITGPSKARGLDVVAGATKTPKGKSHWDALGYVGTLI